MREISEFLEHGEINENTADFLEHYGVIGMKWGLRKAKPSSQSRAFRKSAKKALKLEKRSNKTAVKGAKLVLQGVTKKKQDVYMKGLSLQLKSVKLQKKLIVGRNSCVRTSKMCLLITLMKSHLNKVRRSFTCSPTHHRKNQNETRF